MTQLFKARRKTFEKVHFGVHDKSILAVEIFRACIMHGTYTPIYLPFTVPVAMWFSPLVNCLLEIRK